MAIRLATGGPKVKGGKPFMIDDFSRKKAQKTQKFATDYTDFTVFLDTDLPREMAALPISRGERLPRRRVRRSFSEVGS